MKRHYNRKVREVLFIVSTIQERVDDDLKRYTAEANLYAPMTEEEMLAKLKASREQGIYRDADDVISDMRSKYGL